MYGATWSSLAGIGGCYRLRVPRWIWANWNFLWIIYEEGKTVNFPCCFCSRWSFFHPAGELHPHFSPRHLESEKESWVWLDFSTRSNSHARQCYILKDLQLIFHLFLYLFRSFFTYDGGVGAAMRVSGFTSVPLLCSVVFCTFSTLRASFLLCCYSNGQHEL